MRISVLVYKEFFSCPEKVYFGFISDFFCVQKKSILYLGGICFVFMPVHSVLDPRSFRIALRICLISILHYHFEWSSTIKEDFL